MPLYHKLGTFPKKDIHNSKTKWGLYYEQLLAPKDFTAFLITIMYIDQHKSKKF
jgi:hypothetical protein